VKAAVAPVKKEIDTGALHIIATPSAHESKRNYFLECRKHSEYPVIKGAGWQTVGLRERECWERKSMVTGLSYAGVLTPSGRTVTYT
jgi:hypothetical protein